MRKLLLLLLMGIFLSFPISASAQSDVSLSFATVQLWLNMTTPACW
ncbi:MAG: hypothetical protein U0X74_12135 [Anaerolineales bacterium]